MCRRTLSKNQEIGLGRSWPFPALGERQAIVSGPLLRNIGAAKSDYVTLTIDIADLATVRTKPTRKTTCSFDALFLHSLTL